MSYRKSIAIPAFFSESFEKRNGISTYVSFYVDGEFSKYCWKRHFTLKGHYHHELKIGYTMQNKYLLPNYISFLSILSPFCLSHKATLRILSPIPHKKKNTGSFRYPHLKMQCFLSPLIVLVRDISLSSLLRQRGVHLNWE